MQHRREKMTQLLKDLAGDFLARTSNRSSLITVTNVLLSKDEKRADILISVLPKEKAGVAVDFANRNVDEFRAFVRARAKIRLLPRFIFGIDHGEENRQRIDELGTMART